MLVATVIQSERSRLISPATALECLANMDSMGAIQVTARMLEAILKLAEANRRLLGSIESESEGPRIRSLDQRILHLRCARIAALLPVKGSGTGTEASHPHFRQLERLI